MQDLPTTFEWNMLKILKLQHFQSKYTFLAHPSAGYNFSLPQALTILKNDCTQLFHEHCLLIFVTKTLQVILSQFRSNIPHICELLFIGTQNETNMLKSPHWVWLDVIWDRLASRCHKFALCICDFAGCCWIMELILTPKIFWVIHHFTFLSVPAMLELSPYCLKEVRHLSI